MKDYKWPVMLTAVTLLTLHFVFADVQSPIRPFVTFFFILLCPGMSIVQLLELKRPIVEFTIAVALSMAIGQLVSMAVLYFGQWSAQSIILWLSAISHLGVCIQTVKKSRRRWKVEREYQKVRTAFLQKLSQPSP